MTFVLEKDIFCHSLINPPAEDRACDVNLKFTNSDGLITFTKKEVTLAETIYSIRIPDSLAIGFTSSEQYILTKEFANLILAFNLLLKRACITYRRSEFSPYSVTQIIQKPTKEVRPIVRKIVGGVQAIIREESVSTTDCLRIAVGFSEEIGVRPIIQLFQKIQQIKRFELDDSSSLYYTNLCSAFQNYETGIYEFNMLFKFKSIYNALELATNTDGEKRDEEFDNKVSKLSGISADVVRSWRRFYSRTKHIQRNARDIKTYNSGNQELSKNLSSVRECAQTIILSRLDFNKM